MSRSSSGARAHGGADGRSRVVKMPMAAEAFVGFDTESRALAELHGDRCLGDWARLLPRPRAEKDHSMAAACAWIRRSPGARRSRSWRRMGRLATSSWDAAAETINDLHRLTAASVKAGRHARRALDR